MAEPAGKTKVGLISNHGTFGAEYERAVQDLPVGGAVFINGPGGKPVFVRRLETGEIMFAYHSFFKYRNGKV